MNNSSNNISRVSNKGTGIIKAEESVPVINSLDYYIYARNFPPIKNVLSLDGDMKGFDKKLKDLLDKTILDLGHVKAHLSAEHQKALLGRLRTEVFNYFSMYSIQDLELCFHHGVREKYGPVSHLSIATIHKWFDGFKQDGDRILAIKSEEAKIERLKQELADKKKLEPKLRYMQLYLGLVSVLDNYYAISDSGKTAWVYYDEFRLLNMLKISKEVWDEAFDQAKAMEMEWANQNKGPHFKKLVEDIQSPRSLRVENTTKRLLFEVYIRTAVQNNYCIMEAYEKANNEAFYKLEVPEPNPQFWHNYMIETTLHAHKAFSESKNIKGMHATIYNFLKVNGHMDKLITADDKTKIISQVQQDLYEVFANYKSKSRPETANGILEKIKNEPHNCTQVKYEAKHSLLLIFFNRINEQNINLAELLHGKKDTHSN